MRNCSDSGAMLRLPIVEVLSPNQFFSAFRLERDAREISSSQIEKGLFRHPFKKNANGLP
jgi:hypothetical protein